MTATGPAIITSAPPNPNGDLHLGHLAGPFLGADVLARRLRQDRVALVSGAFIVFLIILAIAAPLVIEILGLPGPNTQNLNLTDEFGSPLGPTGAHPFGDVDQGVEQDDDLQPMDAVDLNRCQLAPLVIGAAEEDQGKHHEAEHQADVAGLEGGAEQ